MTLVLLDSFEVGRKSSSAPSLERGRRVPCSGEGWRDVKAYMEPEREVAAPSSLFLCLALKSLQSSARAA